MSIWVAGVTVRSHAYRALLPVAMGLAVIATANHSIVDVFGGGVIALSSLLGVELLARRRRVSARDSA
jgi:hypothetical protein